MKTTTGWFEVEVTGDTFVVTPERNLSELDSEEITAASTEVLDLFGRMSARNVVLDLHKTDYCGSTALGCFVRLGKAVRVRGGRMAFCNVSEHEREILSVTHLDAMWPFCASRVDALETVRGAMPAGRVG